MHSKDLMLKEHHFIFKKTHLINEFNKKSMFDLSHSAVGCGQGLKFVLPHHTFDRLIRLAAILRIFLLVVLYLSFTFH